MYTIAMTNKTALFIAIGVLTSVVIGLAALAWVQGVRGELTPYVLFPLLGIVAWVLMWMHYVSGSLKRYLGLDGNDTLLRGYAKVTGYIVLCLLLLHPGLLYIALYNDGLGLPPYSAFAVYQTLGMRIALILGSVALTAFLLFELGRWFRHKGWWRYIEWANVAAMGLIFIHGLLIGGGITGWFRVVWVALGLALVAAVAYNWYYDRYIKNGAIHHGREQSRE